ncbi:MULTISPECIES: hypothetical protein [unclassified Cryobacterium]|uniref:hypothetical protein n=1 Tax=unclassified Cryobacterium TaxID=2649013 RepID=UPI00106BE97D|nr:MULTISPECIES: hypothetical protein [unclassified Cryobacterium]TFB98006.1 hypothetical protein E3O39_07345 [Cryobacterium sp. MDB2-A-1]TFC10940.1 hypothetical protein E3O35_12250 [Cryobacterium sp. MDB2-A-2]TFC14417.1 hypothetical protein E3O51_15570 [Cryobacterium sp. MDB2-10]
MGLLLGLTVAAPAQAASIGTGAVSIKGQSSELVPGTTVEIRQGDCSGAPVWRTTTGSTPSAYGAFGIGLTPGAYCIVTLSVPAPYGMPANTTFQMGSGTGNWVTVWLPGPLSGAVVAKNSLGYGINGVTAFIRQGSCASPGQGVWQNVTATNQWSSGGFGISLLPGTYCTSVTDVPWDYSTPQPVETVVSAPGPIWITIWLDSRTVQGQGDSVISIAAYSFQKIVEFTCPDCTSNVIVEALGPDRASDLLINRTGSYPSGRMLVGFLDLTYSSYSQISVHANGHWTLRILDLDMIRQGGSSISGTGDDVVYLDTPGVVATFSNHGTSNFIVWATDPTYGVDNKINVIGNYWGTVAMTSPAIIQITSDGAWSIKTW